MQHVSTDKIPGEVERLFAQATAMLRGSSEEHHLALRLLDQLAVVAEACKTKRSATDLAADATASSRRECEGRR